MMAALTFSQIWKCYGKVAVDTFAKHTCSLTYVLQGRRKLVYDGEAD